MKKVTAVLLTLIIAVSFCGCNDSKTTQPVSKTAFYFDTVVSITLYDGSDASLIDDCFAILSGYESLISRTIPSSEVSLFNASAEGCTFSEKTADMVKAALSYAEDTDGAFDPALGAVTSIWKDAIKEGSLPGDDIITKALIHTGYGHISFEGDCFAKDDPLIELDLGGIAKGYAADVIKEYLISSGVESAIIDLGGNILLIGGNPNKQSGLFRVGIQYPFSDGVIASVDLSGMSIVTSGTYERYFEAEGIIYHHITDPATGYPADNGLLSVTIISSSSADGDALSTACFVMGPEKGMEYIDSLEGIYAIFIDSSYDVHLSDGLEQAFSVTVYK